MAYENLVKKYGVSRTEIAVGAQMAAKNLGKLCDVNVVLAIADLLANGDVQEEPADASKEGTM